MNCGIVTTWFERGASYVSRQYMDILEKNFPVWIYARGGESYAENDSRWNLDNVWWSRKLPAGIAGSIDLTDFGSWLDRYSIELCFFNEEHWNYPVIFCKNRGILCGAYVDYYRENNVRLFDLYDFLICNTKRHFSVFAWHPQAFYVPWGTDVSRFSPASDERTADDGLVFFHSAGLNPYRKGTDLVIKAFDRIKAKKCRLVVHSQSDIAEFFPELSPVIESLIAADKLEIIHATVGAPGLYHRGDVYVYPSRLEGIGLTIAEAMACGLPVITSDNPPMNELVTAESGRFVAVGGFKQRDDDYYWPECVPDLDSLTNALTWYLDHAPVIGDLKQKARDHALRHLNWETNAETLGVVFSSVRPRQASPELIKQCVVYDDLRLSPGARIYHRSKRLFALYRFLKRLKNRIIR